MTDTRHGVWRPDSATVRGANLTVAMHAGGFGTYEEFHGWSVSDRSGFWQMTVDRLGIIFDDPPRGILEGPAEDPTWLSGARLNIVDSCFSSPDDHAALIFRRDGTDHRLTYGELRARVDRFANGLTEHDVTAGDRVAIAMPMTVEAVVAYLGTVAAGAVVVSIADSFAAHEIATRLAITDPKLTVTQDRLVRSGRDLPMYDKVVAAGARACVVVDTGAGVSLRSSDTEWDDFLGSGAPFPPVRVAPDTHANILFSSGTTGEPKAIPWTHLTPVKAAMDGFFHHDIHAGDVVAWPTNLGWMMGPWLIYASLINGATMALFDDVPTGRGFIDFVRDTGVTVLGLVPSISAVWRSTGVLDPAALAKVRVLSSTGEAAVAEDYAWLMKIAGAPMIDYCGGTEIGGGYITGTVLQDAVPATFTTPALGLDVRILDDEGRPARSGELFVVPPSIGLSQELLNGDHDAVYYEGVPEADVPLRRHGDHMERLPDGRWRALGRVDDAMNLGGIKISSAEIERTISGIEGVAEVAAVGVTPTAGGPSRLVVYAVPAAGAEPDPEGWKHAMQREIRENLNPLFRIEDVVVIDELPRTASAKVMRRELRTRYQ